MSSNARLLRVIATPQSGEAVLLLALVLPGNTLVLQSWQASEVQGSEPGAIAEEIALLAQTECDQLSEPCNFSVCWLLGERRTSECGFRVLPRPPEQQTTYEATAQGTLAQILTHKEREGRLQHLATLTALNHLRDAATAAERRANAMSELAIKLMGHMVELAIAPAAAGEPDVWAQAKAVVLDNVSQALIAGATPVLPDLLKGVGRVLMSGKPAAPERAALPAATEQPPAEQPNGLAPKRQAKPKGAGAEPQ